MGPLHPKLHYARLWHNQLRYQYIDRLLHWNLRRASRDFDSTVLTIIIDSMDRKKAVWPNYHFNRKPHEIESLKPKPMMTVTGGIAHGWCTAILIAQETLSHGSNAYVEVLCPLFDKVAELCMGPRSKLPGPSGLASRQHCCVNQTHLCRCLLQSDGGHAEVLHTYDELPHGGPYT